MKTKNRNRILAIGLYAVFGVSLFGTLTGTLAWYTFGNRVPVLYDGSSMGGEVGDLEIGMVGPANLQEAEYRDVYRLTKDTSVPGKTIYWAGGMLQGAAMNYMMRVTGYAYDDFPATTVESYIRTSYEPITLGNSPTYLKYKTKAQEAAYKDSYASFELVFRYKDPDHDGLYLPGKKVYLADMVSYPKNGDTLVYQALRIGVTDEENKTYLIAPAYDSNGENIAAGPLDLKPDGFFDANMNTKVDTHRESEFAYGVFKELYYMDEIPTEDEVRDDSTVDNFNAKYSANVRRIDMERSVPSTIEYWGRENFKSIHPCLGTTEVATTYAFCNLMIYLEGWDHSAIDAYAFTTFAFDLQFELL